MDNILKILLVEDSETDADLLIRFLNREKINFSHSRVWNKDAFLNAINDNDHDLIIADQSLPQFSGMEAFRISKNEKKNIPFILVTGTVTETILTEFAKEGIDDYILKENLLRLPYAIKQALSKKKIEDLNKKLELAHKDIQDSINYAKIIQNAMLPDSAQLSNSFRESFILFKPKDILSGDFYWFKKEGETFFAAVADCTGHGIPGALMSMIGIEKLNNTILKTKKTCEILEQLNESIATALCQSTLHEHSQDGMDIALCSINIENKVLKFSGANRPLWIIRKGETELKEIKGTKKAIGGISSNLNSKFETNEIKLQKGDTIYMFSDGYADQFGGDRKKKLTTKKLKQLLESIQHQTMEQQKKHLNDFIENWKKEEEQVDDILLIGIRLE